MLKIMYSFIDILKYMKIPLIVGILLSVAAAMIGVVLVLKRYSMIGDGLSHVGFGAVAIGLACGIQPLYIAIPFVIISAYVLLRLGESKKVNGDAAIALISSSALAIGFLAGNLSDGFSSDINSYMFGSITTATVSDLYYVLPIALIIIVLLILFFNRIFAITFDESFAKASGINTRFYSIFLSVATALIIVIGIKIMGTLLISSLIIFPALTSMKLFRTFKKVIISSVVVSCTSFLIAFFLFTKFSSAASIVIVNLIFYLIALTIHQIAKNKK